MFNRVMSSKQKISEIMSDRHRVRKVSIFSHGQETYWNKSVRPEIILINRIDLKMYLGYKSERENMTSK